MYVFCVDQLIDEKHGLVSLGNNYISVNDILFHGHVPELPRVIQSQESNRKQLTMVSYNEYEVV